MEPRPGTPFPLEINARIPARLARLEELANNLWYSWDRAARELFARLHPTLWGAVGHGPKAFLRSIDQGRLTEAAEDPVFLLDYQRTLAAYDAYHDRPISTQGAGALAGGDLVAYFCAEFGFHESLPIYSGGLGILAGDYCKTASDLGLPFVAVGLLYRQGYFRQTIDGEGNQHATYRDSEFGHLPIRPVLRDDGEELLVEVDMGEREVHVKVWQARVGRVCLYLLDTDLESNRPEDRATAHRLYVGDRMTRLQQEIVLGMGGVRALLAMGIRPAVWHVNEGHAAFLVLERVRGLMHEGLDLAGALEATAANTIFTTHTAVGAGHDHFPNEAIAARFQRYCRELRLEPEQLLALGRTQGSPDFNMTALAARGSRFQNGVSRIHRKVSARLLGDLWPQIQPEDNPLTYITNGVHVATFLAPEWAELFEPAFGGRGSRRLDDPACLDRIRNLPDHVFWSVRQQLKARLLHLVRHRIRAQYVRNEGSETHLERVLKLTDPANPNVLTIGFGRRFATYKRATLLFENLDWLREILGDRQRPVLLIFAGKAHPADEPGKEMIRRVTRVAALPEFEGRILFVEDYDLRLARRMVSGVDVWLNNPVYPLEASGTSGMKAGFNGVINLSVLDGWWEEGYQGDNGWAMKPASWSLDDERRNREESRSLYELLQDRVIPLYYERGEAGFSPEWIRLAKRSMLSLLPRFNSERMVGEYVERCYGPAARRGRRFAAGGFAVVREVAAWKQRVREAWPAVALRAIDAPNGRISTGDKARFSVGVRMNALAPVDIVVELLLEAATNESGESSARASHVLACEGEVGAAGEWNFGLDLAPGLCGTLEYRIRAYPFHPELTHRFEMGLMKWL